MNYVSPFVKWLLQSEYIKKNKLFLNAVEAQDSNIQIVTQQIARNEDKRYIDGSVLHKVRFTVFDFKSISFNLRKEEHRLLYYCEGYAELCKLLKYLGKTNGL